MQRPVIFIPSSIFLLFLVLFLSQQFFLLARVEQQSMEPVLDNGQLVLVQRMGRRLPQRGEILVFQSPDTGQLMVKRCLLLGGDNLEIENHWLRTPQGDYYLTRNQEELLSQQDCVPQDSYLLLGDNQFHSRDSRDFGFITRDLLYGKVVLAHE